MSNEQKFILTMVGIALFIATFIAVVFPFPLDWIFNIGFLIAMYSSSKKVLTNNRQHQSQDTTQNQSPSPEQDASEKSEQPSQTTKRNAPRRNEYNNQSRDNT